MIKEIKKRNGDIVPFDQTKILLAMKKAFAAESVPVDDDVLEQITDRVVAKITPPTENEEVPTVERVQDLVEETLMERGYFKVAKHYILYRFQHTEERQEQVVKDIEENRLIVLKRDGHEESFSREKVRATLQHMIRGYENDIDLEGLVKQVELEVYNNIKTSELARLITLVLRSRMELDPAYSHVTARQLCSRIYTEAIGKNIHDDAFEQHYKDAFVRNMRRGIEGEKLDPRLNSFDLDQIAAALRPERDDLMRYLGVETLHDRYFIKDSEGKVLETPQYMWMRVAIGLAINEEEKEARAIEFYDMMSQLRFIPSTPTLFHAGTPHPQLSSCYLNVVEDDLNHIFKVYGDNAQLSKWAGGIGTSWSKLRGTGAYIKGGGMNSQGVLPFLKIANDVTVAINRSGRRRGATCVYLENWHYDFEEFVELRKNTGDERRRTHDINTAAWISDLFMKRVKEDAQWTFFSPDETPELTETYGKTFEEHYTKYEEMADRGEIKLFKRMKARDLWKKMLGMLFETGHPWITFKDPANVRSPQDHAGVIHNSNLCTEITLNTSAEETAVCNLGSVHLHTHVTDGKFDIEKTKETVRIAMRMLDNVIDLNFYPTKEARNSNMKHRPVGLGISGFQDALYQQGIHFASEECVRFADFSMEVISHAAIMGSSLLARERGAYESYKGSKWDRGLFPVDTIALLEEERGMSISVDRTEQLDWSEVRESVRQYGMRNSNTMAIAPTATTANIAGSIPAIEPIYKNMYVKANISGDFVVVNPYLIADLKARGVWSEEMLNAIKYEDGSVQNIPNIPQDIKEKYRETFEIDMRWLIRAAAARGKWIDQTQSLNIFFNGTSGAELSELYLYAWEMGLKTTYYLRSMAATQVEKSTVGNEGTHLRKKHENKNEDTDAQVTAEKSVNPAGVVPSPIPTPSPMTKETVEANMVMSAMKRRKEEDVAQAAAEEVAVLSSSSNKPKKYNLHVAEDSICESCQS